MPFLFICLESPAEAGCKQKQMKYTYTRRPLRLCGDSVYSKVRVRQCLSSERSEWQRKHTGTHRYVLRNNAQHIKINNCALLRINVRYL